MLRQWYVFDFSCCAPFCAPVLFASFVYSLVFSFVCCTYNLLGANSCFMYCNDVSEDRKEWISLEKDRHRIAPFGTKSDMGGGGNNSSISISGLKPDAISATATVEAAPTGGSAQNSSTGCAGHGDGDSVDPNWKPSSLVVGDLVDARDGNQVWYQVIVKLYCFLK
jgi:hypothetical protein